LYGSLVRAYFINNDKTLRYVAYYNDSSDGVIIQSYMNGWVKKDFTINDF